MGFFEFVPCCSVLIKIVSWKSRNLLGFGVLLHVGIVGEGMGFDVVGDFFEGLCG